MEAGHGLGARGSPRGSSSNARAWPELHALTGVFLLSLSPQDA